MLKIALVTGQDGAGSLRLDGQLIGPWVEEVERACRAGLAGLSGLSALTLDLARVSFVDHAGIDLLLRLERSSVRLCGQSPFVAEQLRAGGRRAGGAG